MVSLLTGVEKRGPTTTSMADDRCSSSPPKQVELPLLIPLPKETEFQKPTHQYHSDKILLVRLHTYVATYEEAKATFG